MKQSVRRELTQNNHMKGIMVSLTSFYVDTNACNNNTDLHLLAAGWSVSTGDHGLCDTHKTEEDRPEDAALGTAEPILHGQFLRYLGQELEDRSNEVGRDAQALVFVWQTEV